MTTSLDFERKISGLEDQRYQAVLDGEYNVLERLFHDQLVYTHSSGNVDSATTYLEKLRSGGVVYHHIDHPIEKVLLSGNAAIVVGQMNASLTLNGAPLTLTNRSLAIWVMEAGDWKFLAYQATPGPVPVVHR